MPQLRMARTRYTNDPLDISTSDIHEPRQESFCAADWVMKLEPTRYKVDVTQCARSKTDAGTRAAITDIIAEQIIGFKVGAATRNQPLPRALSTYSFYAQNASTATPPGYSSNFALVRSVRVTLIGRTNPNPDPTYTFRNTFDEGPYQVLDATVVINPRNLTMNGN